MSCFERSFDFASQASFSEFGQIPSFGHSFRWGFMISNQSLCSSLGRLAHLCDAATNKAPICIDLLACFLADQSCLSSELFLNENLSR